MIIKNKLHAVKLLKGNPRFGTMEMFCGIEVPIDGSDVTPTPKTVPCPDCETAKASAQS